MSSHTILLVEDNEDDVFLMELALKAANIFNPLQVVEDGERAVDYLAGAGAYADRRKFPFPAVVFLDVKLPYMSGFDVLAWMRSRSDLPRPPVIVLSSSNSPRDMELASTYNASYAVKPPTTELFERIADEFNFQWRREPLVVF